MIGRMMWNNLDFCCYDQTRNFHLHYEIIENNICFLINSYPKIHLLLLAVSAVSDPNINPYNKNCSTGYINILNNKNK